MTASTTAGVRTVAPERPRLPSLGSLPLHIAVIGLTAMWVVPTLGLFVSSFRPAHLVTTTGWWTALAPPFQFTLDNYESVLTANNMDIAFVNSLTLAIPATIMPLVVAAFAAYAFSWMEFRFRDELFLILVALLVIPLQATLIPVLRTYSELGLNGTFLGVWLAHTGYGLPFAVYLLRNFIGALPRELFEAAHMDGAGHLSIFFRIVLPLSVPALASLAIFQFLWVWNDLLVALVYLGGTQSVAPLTVAVSNMVSSLGRNWQVLTAAAFITTALPLVLFFSLQRYFVRGITAGSVKG